MEGEGNGNETFSNLISLKFPLSVEKGQCTIRGKVRLNVVCLVAQRDDLLGAKLGLRGESAGNGSLSSLFFSGDGMEWQLQAATLMSGTGEIQGTKETWPVTCPHL